MGNDSDLKLRIKQSIVKSLKLNRAPESIADEDLFVGGGLHLDSVDVLTLVWGLENEFNIKIRDEEVRRLNSVSQVAEYVKAKSSGNQ